MEKDKFAELTEDEVQAIAKALADPRRYDIIKRISRCTRPMACETIRECLDTVASHEGARNRWADQGHALWEMHELRAPPRCFGIIPCEAPPRVYR